MKSKNKILLVKGNLNKMVNIEILKVKGKKVFIAPKGQMLKSFVHKDIKNRDEIMRHLFDAFSNMDGVVTEANLYLTNVFNSVRKKYPKHKIIYRKDDGNFIELYYEEARHICGGMGTKSGVKVVCYKEKE